MPRKMNKTNNYFHTSNFYASAFLFAKGMELVNVDKVTNPKRAHFVFVDIPGREELLKNYNFGKEDSLNSMVDARKFVLAIKTLKDKLYQNDSANGLK